MRSDSKSNRRVFLAKNEHLLVTPDQTSLYDTCADMIVQSAKQAITERGLFSIALSGGSTPKALFELLATEKWRDRIEWGKTHVFWGDERWVPSTDKQSNYKMANDALLSKVNLPRQNIHPMETDSGTPAESAQHYEAELRKILGEPVSIDFNLLGVGTNGHTASLFPHRPTLEITDRLVVADNIPEVQMYRVTMTVPAINNSRQLVFLVSGKEKAAVLHEVLRGPHDPQKLPSQLIHPTTGSLTWLADADAAAQVS